MKEDKYIALIYKQLSGEISPTERSDLEDWKQASDANRRLAKSLEKSWQLSENYDREVSLDLDAEFARLEERIGADEGAGKIVAIPRRNRWLRIAASVAVLIISGFLVQNLFLKSPEWLVLETGNEEQKSLDLFDGTKISLNENSSLSYLETEWRGKRLILLEGEAFFEVAENKNAPFIIETGSGRVRVLGTSFNVRDYAKEEEMQVVVQSGKVRMTPNVGDKHLELEALDKGIFEKNEYDLHKRQDKSQNDLAWHTQVLDFDNTPLHQVLREVAKLYDIKIELEEENLRRCSFNNKFEKKSFQVVLNIIAGTFSMELDTQSEGVFILKGGNCPLEN